MSYTLHNIFEPHAPCVGNDTLRGFEALDFSRKECFLLPVNESQKLTDLLL
jgi:hypothetical protein